MRVQNVISRTELKLVLGPEIEIEDAGDDFITEDEEDQLVHQKWYWISTNTYFSIIGVDEALRELVSTIGSDNSVQITDPELLEMIKHHYYLADFDGDRWRRIGDKLFRKSTTPTKPKKSTPNKQESKNCIDLAMVVIAAKYNMEDMKLKGAYRNVHKDTFKFIRHNITLKEMLKWCEDNDDRCRRKPVTIDHIKYLFNEYKC